MWVPHKEKKNIKPKDFQMHGRRKAEGRRLVCFFLVFILLFFFLRFTETCPSEFVGINTESALRDEGYA